MSNKCHGVKKDGDPCTRSCLAGTDYCMWHQPAGKVTEITKQEKAETELSRFDGYSRENLMNFVRNKTHNRVKLNPALSLTAAKRFALKYV